MKHFCRKRVLNYHYADSPNNEGNEEPHVGLHQHPSYRAVNVFGCVSVCALIDIDAHTYIKLLYNVDVCTLCSH